MSGNNVTFAIDENSAAGAPLGAPRDTPVVDEDVDADDPQWRSLKYTIAGADADAFEVDAATGQLSVAPSGRTLLDFEKTTGAGVGITFAMTVTDGGGLADTVTVTVEVADVNEPPVFAVDVVQTVRENSAANEFVGYPLARNASDPDVYANQKLQYALVGGGDTPFEVERCSGQLYVGAAGALDHERNATYTWCRSPCWTSTSLPSSVGPPSSARPKTARRAPPSAP